jgi:hypothetical protein
MMVMPSIFVILFVGLLLLGSSLAASDVFASKNQSEININNDEINGPVGSCHSQALPSNLQILVTPCR